jgi:hypothetical protein
VFWLFADLVRAVLMMHSFNVCVNSYVAVQHRRYLCI